MNFYSERPILNKDDDKLNRSLFAEILAESILHYDGEDCLIIGLIGKWGSGKSSIINMAVDSIQSENLIIINFNPWYFSTQDNLYQQFFNLIVTEIEKREFGDKFWVQKKWFQLKTQWDYASRIEKGNKSIMQYGKEIVLTLRELQHSDIINKYYNQVKSNSAINLNAPGLGYTYNFTDSKKEYNSISYLKTKCNEYFKSLDYKFLIIIDDLDRMTKFEIEQTLILVKSLADFDDFIYLLAFDDEIVSESLSNVPEKFQKLFLEKIIQVYLTVPKFSESHLNGLISDRLEDFYKNFVIDESNDENVENNRELPQSIQKEFLDIYSYLKMFFKSPRDLYRFINILNFNFSVFKDEVNRKDFILILAIQLFEPNIYHEIKNNKDLFIVNYVNLTKLEKEENKGYIEDIIKLKSNNLSKNIVRDILFKLFPKIESYYRNIEYGSEWDDSWKYERRICSKKFFEKYFTLTLETDEISIVSIQNLLSASDSNSISDTILEFNNNHKTKDLFDLMINRMEDIPKENAQYFISSLIDIGDLLEIPYNMFFDKRIYLSRILHDLLKKYDTKDERFEVLKNAISNSKRSLYVAVDLLAGFDFDYNKFDYKNDKPSPDVLISEEHLEVLEEIMKNKIREWDEDGRLWENPNLEGILYSWKSWDKEGYVIKRVGEYTADDENLLKFLNGFKSVATTTMHRNSPSDVEFKLNFKSLENYFDLYELNDRLKRIGKQ